MTKNLANKLQTLLLLFLFLFIVWGVEGRGYGIRINRSTSFPYSIFLSRYVDQPLMNNYVTIEHPHFSVKVAKKVVGVEGDLIEVIEGHVFVNQQEYGPIKPISPSGRHLTPITEQIIPEGYVYVHAYHENSFDSRYQEFGLVSKEWIKEELWPIF